MNDVFQNHRSDHAVRDQLSTTIASDIAKQLCGTPSRQCHLGVRDVIALTLLGRWLERDHAISVTSQTLLGGGAAAAPPHHHDVCPPECAPWQL